MCAHTRSEYLNSAVLWHNTISRLSEFMRNAQKTILAILTALTLSALVAVIFTWQWGDYRARLRAMRSNLKQQEALVDTRALDTAEQLSQLAESRREKTYAQEALRLADYSVDAAFAEGLQDAAHEDLIRAGGDKQATIQRLRDQHEASQKAAATQASASSSAGTAPSIELTESSSLVAQVEAWLSFNSKQTLLRQAQQNALDRQGTILGAHETRRR